MRREGKRCFSHLQECMWLIFWKIVSFHYKINIHCLPYQCIWTKLKTTIYVECTYYNQNLTFGKIKYSSTLHSWVPSQRQGGAMHSLRQSLKTQINCSSFLILSLRSLCFLRQVPRNPLHFILHNLRIITLVPYIY